MDLEQTLCETSSWLVYVRHVSQLPGIHHFLICLATTAGGHSPNSLQITTIISNRRHWKYHHISAYNFICHFKAPVFPLPNIISSFRVFRHSSLFYMISPCPAFLSRFPAYSNILLRIFLHPIYSFKTWFSFIQPISPCFVLHLFILTEAAHRCTCIFNHAYFVTLGIWPCVTYFFYSNPALLFSKNI